MIPSGVSNNVTFNQMYAALANYLPTSGGIMTGAILETAPITLGAQLVTKDYVDALSTSSALTAVTPLNISSGAIRLNPISDSNIATTANINTSKLAALTSSKNVVTDVSGKLTTTNSNWIPTTGGTISGDILASSSTTQNMGLTTKSYVDSKFSSSGSGSFVGGSNVVAEHPTLNGQYSPVHLQQIPAGILNTPGDRIICRFLLSCQTTDFDNFITVFIPPNSYDLHPYGIVPDINKNYRLELELVLTTTTRITAAFFYITDDTFYQIASPIPDGTLMTSYLSGGGETVNTSIVYSASTIWNVFCQLRSSNINLVSVVNSSWEFKPAAGVNGPIAGSSPITVASGIVSLSPISNQNIASGASIDWSKMASLNPFDYLMVGANGKVVSTTTNFLELIGGVLSGPVSTTGYSGGSNELVPKSYVDSVSVGTLTASSPITLSSGRISLSPITDSSIASGANISLSKLASLTASSFVKTDVSGKLTTGTIPNASVTTMAPYTTALADVAADGSGQLWIRPPPLPTSLLLSVTRTTPPSSSNPGDTYYVPTGATGVWATSVGSLATSFDGVSLWTFSAPSQTLGYSTADTNLTYTYNGTTMVQVAQNISNYLPLSGGTMTGAITLPSNPTLALQAATKQYVDSVSGSSSGSSFVGCYCMSQGTGQTLYSGQFNQVPFNGTGTYAAYDPYGMHSTTTNPSRFVIKTAGIYYMTAGVRCNDSSSNSVGIYFYRNGSALNDTGFFSSETVGTRLSGSAIYARSLSVNDYIELYLYTTGSVVLYTATISLMAYQPSAATALPTIGTANQILTVNSTASGIGYADLVRCFLQCQSGGIVDASSFVFYSNTTGFIKKDPYGMYNPTTNTQNITVKVAGIYRVILSYRLNDDGGITNHGFSLNKNGAYLHGTYGGHDTSGRCVGNLSCLSNCIVGDYFSLTAVLAGSPFANIVLITLQIELVQ